jgi:hypothetical protein
MAKKKRNSAFWSKLAMVLLFAVVVIYTAYHMISFFKSEELRTIVSGVTEEKITVGGDGYVFRDETVVYSNYTGLVDYSVTEGEKVSVGQSLADVYKENSDDEIRSYVALLDEQIAMLEQCSGDNISTVDLSALRKSADDTYDTLARLIATGEAGELDYQIDKMMFTLTKIRAVTQGDASVVSVLSTLRAERDKYMSGEYEKIYSTQSGYFYSSIDGYESAFSMKAVEELSIESFDTLVESTKSGVSFMTEDSFGKLAPDSRWRFVLKLDAGDVKGFEMGGEYKVNFPEKNNTTLVMTLENSIVSQDQKSALLVFYCNILPDNFSFDRCMTARIERSSVSGIYVPRSAVHTVSGVRGVYVLRGNVAYFRRIDIIYMGEDYFLVSERDDSDGKYYYLGENELIITNGKNLFDGRIME